MHYIILEILRATNFGQGLYSMDECDVRNISPRQYPNFIDRIELCVAICTGRPRVATYEIMTGTSRTAPFITAQFFLGLCRVAQVGPREA